ncbi:MAG: hypothetical protein KDB27_12925 [Planctomycetales bacterium]|nr:hypothetical protein [Planctomycetales bacterium]
MIENGGLGDQFPGMFRFGPNSKEVHAADDMQPSNLDLLTLGLLRSRALSSNKLSHGSKLILVFKQQLAEQLQDCVFVVRVGAVAVSGRDLSGSL